MAVSVQHKRALEIRARMLAKQKRRRVQLPVLEEEVDKRRSTRLSRAALGGGALAALRLSRKRKQTITKKRFEQHAGITDLMPSSFISYLFYHEKQTVVQMRLNGRNYYAKGVPKNVFIDWSRGAASCRTNDTSSLKRWTIGKTPSLGAYFDQNIKGKYTITSGVFRP